MYSHYKIQNCKTNWTVLRYLINVFPHTFFNSGLNLEYLYLKIVCHLNFCIIRLLIFTEAMFQTSAYIKDVVIFLNHMTSCWNNIIVHCTLINNHYLLNESLLILVNRFKSYFHVHTVTMHGNSIHYVQCICVM